MTLGYSDVMFGSYPLQVVMKEDTGKSMRPIIELVRCKLTLFYDYWQMNEVFQTRIS